MRRRTALGLAAAALAGAALPATAGSARRIFPADQEVVFTALRLGQPIGEHRIRFLRRDGAFLARTEVAIEAEVSGATLLRFRQNVEEVWRAGWLDALISDTDDNGRRFRVRAERDEDGIFGGAVNGARFTVSGYIIPSSLWHRDTPFSEALLDVADARVKLVRGALLGEDEVPVDGKPVPARHYALSGEIRRELWYDEARNLVRVGYLGRDGAPIVLELR